MGSIRKAEEESLNTDTYSMHTVALLSIKPVFITVETRGSIVVRGEPVHHPPVCGEPPQATLL